MSDYCRQKVVRCKVSPEQLGVEDLWDIVYKYPELFKKNENGYFEIAPTESDFIDFLFFSTYGEESSDWGRTRALSEKELEKYLPIFKQIHPNVQTTDLRYVDYCWYNCTEAPDYFDETTDDFYDDI